MCTEQYRRSRLFPPRYRLNQVGNNRFQLSPPAKGRYQPGCSEREGRRGRIRRRGELGDPAPLSLDDPDSLPQTSPPPLLLVASNEEKTVFFSSFEATRIRGGEVAKATS
ncbi:hypothetical protein BHE74_00059272 [Ensete ventricosum]|nr:hypothetical protein GW17_00033156 [Ensete ventricosum]RWW35758.1 hypothetical protein BHE74_00059272 [Ensete ventricosum]RZS27852.1 hypothetical protein BHM03_00061378 [Ensete ventricosum]